MSGVLAFRSTTARWGRAVHLPYTLRHQHCVGVRWHGMLSIPDHYLLCRQGIWLREVSWDVERQPLDHAETARAQPPTFR